jgi:hypothetical protein
MDLLLLLLLKNEVRIFIHNCRKIVVSEISNKYIYIYIYIYTTAVELWLVGHGIYIYNCSEFYKIL